MIGTARQIRICLLLLGLLYGLVLLAGPIAPY